ncbi:MAG: hypothetical protein LQ346_006835 [Caloplaca aetnensis]|nr:MAG: hypothetical protein LQ346_006835 [Caloplaca aetnensis]
MTQPFIFDLTLTRQCEAFLKYTFRDPLLLWEALLADGALSNTVLLGSWIGATPRYQNGNKRLAIIGDGILDMFLRLKWYPTWTTTQGETEKFNDLRTQTVSNAALQAVGNRARLDRYLTVAPGTESIEQRTMSATVEAIVGAAYLDGGMDAARKAVEAIGVDVL